MTWKEMAKKYPEYRDDMAKEREREFVNDCFLCYEEEGFAKKFFSQWDDYKEYAGETFEVIKRVPEYDAHHTDGADLECLPMWTIRFADGKEIDAYPEEIIQREIDDWH